MLRSLTIMSVLFCMAFPNVCPCMAGAAELVGGAKGPETRARVALLRDKIEGLDLADVDELAAGLEKLGFGITKISCEDLASPVSFSAARFDWLILTRSPDFPIVANENFLRYLKGGGNVVLMGGHAFTHPLAKYRDQVWRTAGLWEYQGRFMPPSEVAAMMAGAAPLKKILFDFENGNFRSWQRNTSEPEAPTRLLSDTGHCGKGLRMEIKGLNGWDMHMASITWRLPARHNVIGFWARGDSRTPQLLVEIHEKDGSRWVSVVNLTTHWQRYALGEHDFRYLDKGEKTKRGGPDDCLNMRRARTLSFGLAASITNQPPGDHTLWIDEVGSGRVDLPKDLFPPEVGAPNVISDYEPVAIKGMARVAPSSGQILVHESFTGAGDFAADEVIGFNLEDRATFLRYFRPWTARVRTGGASAECP